MGIIDSLSAGYRLTLQRLDLLIVPVVLDLLLWLLPRWGVGPIVERVAGVYQLAVEQATQQAPFSPDMAEISQGNLALLSDLGGSFNLLTGLISGSLLHVPSLALTASLPPSPGVWELTNAGAALGLWLLLLLAGLLIGVVFLEQAARVIPLGAGDKPAGALHFLQAVRRHWGRVLGFALLMIVALGVLIVPASAIVGLLLLILPGLAMAAWGLLVALSLMIFLFLYFVTAAIVLDDLGVIASIQVSFALVRMRLLRVLGFVLLVNIIGAGTSILLANLAAMQPVGTVIAILLNSFIGTGMAVGLLVFYRSHLLHERQAAAIAPK